ncbi:hypothetical protein EK21DRAFT_93690 [Setomelanomma holmii]|uniref:BTB domain-containing protein n=1 Tax=Setomelanomma holmii TaxID=210430 RepID=A0A9P4GYC9_9PLEO|nr:hypothetical protein EK21DRAFT_93690 [Setomelanomma holmii]
MPQPLLSLPLLLSQAKGEKRKRPTSLSMDQAQVEIILDDDEEKTLMMYKELLCFYSEYFQRAFAGQFLESEEKSIRLHDVTERTFRLYQVWRFAQAAREESGTVANRHLGRSETYEPWKIPSGLAIPERAPPRRYIARRYALSYHALGAKNTKKQMDAIKGNGKDFMADIVEVLLFAPKDQLLAQSLKFSVKSTCAYHEHKTKEEGREFRA